MGRLSFLLLAGSTSGSRQRTVPLSSRQLSVDWILNFIKNYKLTSSSGGKEKGKKSRLRSSRWLRLSSFLLQAFSPSPTESNGGPLNNVLVWSQILILFSIFTSSLKWTNQLEQVSPTSIPMPTSNQFLKLPMRSFISSSDSLKSSLSSLEGMELMSTWLERVCEFDLVQYTWLQLLLLPPFPFPFFSAGQ